MRRSRLHRSRGFTLLELGMVLGVIVILTAVILFGVGAIEGSRTAAAAQLVDSIRQGARTFAKQENGGISFEDITLAKLRSPEHALLPPTVKTPWKQQNFKVVPWGADSTYVEVSFCVPTAETCQELCEMLRPTVHYAGCIGGNTGCADGGALFQARTR